MSQNGGFATINIANMAAIECEKFSVQNAGKNMISVFTADCAGYRCATMTMTMIIYLFLARTKNGSKDLMISNILRKLKLSKMMMGKLRLSDTMA